jgi:inner membrane protein
MASAITHFVVGASLALPAAARSNWSVPVTAGLLAVAPDLDTYLMLVLGIPRGTLFAHRGFFHSALFLLVFCLLVAAARTRRDRIRLGLLWAMCAVTHPLLDMLTDGGSGVMLLYPFETARLFFPWRPIHVSPLGILQFFSRAGYILKSELPFCAAALAIGLVGFVARRR